MFIRVSSSDALRVINMGSPTGIRGLQFYVGCERLAVETLCRNRKFICRNNTPFYVYEEIRLGGLSPRLKGGETRFMQDFPAMRIETKWLGVVNQNTEFQYLDIRKFIDKI